MFSQASRGFSNSQHAFDLRLVHTTTRSEIIKGFARRVDDVAFDEWRTFGGTLIRRLQAAFPFQNGPGVIVVLRKLGKDRGEIHLAVTQ